MNKREQKTLLNEYNRIHDLKRTAWKNYQRAEKEHESKETIQMFRYIWNEFYVEWNAIHRVLTLLKIDHNY